MNNDGTSDIVGDDYGPLTIFYGQPTRTFISSSVPAAQMAGMNPMLADINGDGRKDVVYASFPPRNNEDIGVSTLLHSVSGTFRQLGFETIDTYHAGHGQVPFYQSFVGDYNRDGRLDRVRARDDRSTANDDVDAGGAHRCGSFSVTGLSMSP